MTLPSYQPTEAEALIYNAEIVNPVYVADAAAWAEHYTRQAIRYSLSGFDWFVTFGEVDPAYTRATGRAQWLAVRWAKVAERAQ